MDIINTNIDTLRNLRDIIDIAFMEAAYQYQDDIIDIIQKQLFNGLSGTGAPLEPTYDTDTWFKSPASRAAYLQWKEQISQRTVPSNGSPNLYINGEFHNSLYPIIDTEEIEIESNSINRTAIFNKFGKENFAPNDEWIEKTIIEYIKDYIKSSL
jgi:hypothetical protein